MYQFILGKISTLSAGPVASALAEQAPQGARRSTWLAGRTLLSHALSPSPLPEIVFGEQGKPAFVDHNPFWFNLSHSGDDIALFISDQGEVGCDIEVVRPRENWQALANAVFSVAEHQELERETPEDKLPAFWRIWTRKEAIVKQRGGSAWQIVSVDSAATQLHSVSHIAFGSLSLAVCTPMPFTLTSDLIARP
jgi:4'-phosphopantetheinyl transferase